MYLIDTCVISEIRKGVKANTGVQHFFAQQMKESSSFLSVLTLGELRKGVDKILLRNDLQQGKRLSDWLDIISDNYTNKILDFDKEAALLWGRLCASDPSNIIDKQIAATALVYDLTIVTRNKKDFIKTGVRVLNPFID